MQLKKAQQKRLYQDVLFLTELRPFRNYQNLDSLNRVVNYISNEIEICGLSYSYQSWIADDNEYRNVLCSYQPEKEKRLIMGAHYDVCGDQPGADDNASAVAGLLETIRLVTENKYDMDYGIDFVFYCLEEPPFFNTSSMGSYVHAKSIASNKDNIIGMICYEMIGYFSDEPFSQDYPSPFLSMIYPTTANFIMTVGIEKYKDFNQKVFNCMKRNKNIDVFNIDFPTSDSLAGMSDHLNYWKFDIPALMINDTSFLRNPHYHEITDDIETLNFEKMTEVVNSILNFFTCSFIR